MKRPKREDPAERRLRLAADFEVESDDEAAGLYGRIFAIAAGVGRKRLGGEDLEGDGILRQKGVKSATTIFHGNMHTG